jgi:predicted RNA-binding protein YlxR (DUF448 family)
LEIEREDLHERGVYICNLVPLLGGTARRKILDKVCQEAYNDMNEMHS